MKRLLGIIFIAFVLAVLLRLFVFDTVSVASHAMHKSYSVGDRLIVEKWSLGARMPLSIKMPFSSKIKSVKKPWLKLTDEPYRFSGFSFVRHNDLIVYNNPVKKQDVPFDLSPTLLSRCAGLPGDTVKVVGSKLFINGKYLQRPFDITTCFQFPYKDGSEVQKILKKTYPESEIFHREETGFIFLTQYEYIKLVINESDIKMPLVQYKSIHDSKQIILPEKGQKLMLNKKNIELWRDLLDNYENVRISMSSDGRYEVDGKVADTYSFKHDYYWLLNDHQGYLNDSRTFGVVPECLIIGKACLILYSPVKKRLFQKI